MQKVAIASAMLAAPALGSQFMAPVAEHAVFPAFACPMNSAPQGQDSVVEASDAKALSDVIGHQRVETDHMFAMADTLRQEGSDAQTKADEEVKKLTKEAAKASKEEAAEDKFDAVAAAAVGKHEKAGKELDATHVEAVAHHLVQQEQEELEDDASIEKVSEEDAHSLVSGAKLQVPQLSAAQLTAMQGDKSKDTFLVFYAPWCGHCQHFVMKEQGPLEQLHAEFKKDGALASLNVASYDVTTNKVPAGFEVQYIPTMYFLPAGKLPVKYTAQSAELSVVKAFIKQHAVKAVLK